MGWINDAVNEGVRVAFEDECLSKCEGADDPEDRCPMNPRECICHYVRFRKLPWWKKLFLQMPPRRPSIETVINRNTDIAIHEAVELRLSTPSKPTGEVK